MWRWRWRPTIILKPAKPIIVVEVSCPVVTDGSASSANSEVLNEWFPRFGLLKRVNYKDRNY